MSARATPDSEPAPLRRCVTAIAWWLGLAPLALTSCGLTDPYTPPQRTRQRPSHVAARIQPAASPRPVDDELSEPAALAAARRFARGYLAYAYGLRPAADIR